MDSLYKKTEKWLYNLDALKQRIENLKMYQSELLEAGAGIDYSKDKIGQTYKFNSATENTAEKRENIEQEIRDYETRVHMIVNALDILNDTERSIIESRYFNQEPWYNIGYKHKYSERQCKRIRTGAIIRLSMALFGE
jgi:ArpU family phage transcriptional regulator